MRNADPTVTTGFGREWSTFTQSESSLEQAEREGLFAEYFRIFPWPELPTQAEGLDAGCGSGRWAFLVAPRVGRLHVLDASRDALEVAKANLAGQGNVAFHYASVNDIPLVDNSLDFAYSLGVLHHVPDTAAAVRHIGSKLKPDAPFLIYLYYALDNRPAWFRAIWQVTDLARMAIARLPARLKLFASELIAAVIYWPIARFCRALSKLGLSTRLIPLEAYKDRSFYTMRTDAYDRFCTSLEQRFSRKQIREMLEQAGFDRIVFSEEVPFWCAVGRKRSATD